MKKNEVVRETEPKQTEAFRDFIRVKQFDVSDALGLLDRSVGKLKMLEDYFLYRESGENDLTEEMSLGVAGVLGDIGSDIRLISAGLAAEVDRDIAEFKKRQAEEKKREGKKGTASPVTT